MFLLTICFVYNQNIYYKSNLIKFMTWTTQNVPVGNPENGLFMKYMKQKICNMILNIILVIFNNKMFHSKPHLAQVEECIAFITNI